MYKKRKTVTLIYYSDGRKYVKVTVSVCKKRLSESIDIGNG